MPAKRSKPKTKKKKAKVAPSTNIVVNEKAASDKDAEFYIKQIHHLEFKLERYQKKCDELEVLMTKSDGLYKSVVVDKNDVVSYLTKELEKKDNEVSQLNHKFTDLTASKKEADALHIKERDSLRKKYEEMLDDSRAENTDLQIKIKSLENFAIEKENTDRYIAELEAKIEELKNQHVDEIYKLEKNHLIDKERRKNELREKLNDLSNQFRGAFNDQITMSTKKVIQENISLNLQMKKLNAMANDLLFENEKLRQTCLKHKIQIESLDEINEEQSKSFMALSKVTNKLLEKTEDQKDIEEINETLRLTELTNMKLESIINMNRSYLQKLQRDILILMDTKKSITLNSLIPIISYLKKINEATEDMVEEPDFEEVSCQSDYRLNKLSNTKIENELRKRRLKLAEEAPIPLSKLNEKKKNKILEELKHIKEYKEKSVYKILKKEIGVQTCELTAKYHKYIHLFDNK